jgi:hypothetical protein
LDALFSLRDFPLEVIMFNNSARLQSAKLRMCVHVSSLR